MKSRLDRPPMGWPARARGFLILIVATLSSTLARLSTGPETAEVAVPTLSVDANSAPAPVLMALPSIGPATSRTILEARKKEPFGSMADFDRRVRGIGPARAAALRPYLRFDPTPAPHP